MHVATEVYILSIRWYSRERELVIVIYICMYSSANW